MDKTISVKDLIKELKTSQFLLACEMPLGYVEGMPILQVRRGEPCLMIPFLRYRVTGKVDQTLVFPIRYAVTIRARDGKVVQFVDLTADGRFAKVDFNKPIGLFRHEAIRSWNKKTYAAKKDELMALYGKACDAILAGETVDPEIQTGMKELLSVMVEPCQMPVYQALDQGFYNDFLN